MSGEELEREVLRGCPDRKVYEVLTVIPNQRASSKEVMTDRGPAKMSLQEVLKECQEAGPQKVFWEGHCQY